MPVHVTTPPPLGRINRVELIHTGEWKISTGKWTATRDDLIAAVAALDCPAVRRPVLKLGHSLGDEPRWQGNPTGEPALGWVDNLHLTNQGHTLVGDFVGVPAWLVQIAASAYPDRSVEGTYDFRCQLGHTHPFVLTAVALLGVTPPGVGTLRSLQDVASLYGATTVAATTATHDHHDDGDGCDPDVDDLVWALDRIANPGQVAARKWDPHAHPRWPAGTGRGGQFRAKLADTLRSWVDDDSSGDPLDGFTGDQLHRAARRRGVQLPRGASRDETARALLEDTLARRDEHADTWTPTSRRRPGRNLLDQVQAEFGDILDEADQFDGDYGDRPLTAVVHRQDGWADPAQVGTPEQVDAAIAAGWTQLWRGVAGTETVPAAELAEQTRTGQWRMGEGIFGNGVYMSTRRTTAEYFRGSGIGDGDVNPDSPGWNRDNDEWEGGFDVRHPGGLVRIALDPNARLADYDDLEKEHYEYLERISEDPDIDIDYAMVAGDISWYAAAAGYDGFIAPDRGDGAPYPGASRAAQYVIFNRSVLLIEEATSNYDAQP